MRKNKRRASKQTIDKNKVNTGRFVFLVLLLSSLGLVAVADASAPQAYNTFSDKFYFVKQQAVWLVVGLVSMVILSKIHYTFWKKFTLPFFVVTLLLLVAVFIPGIESKVMGARRWIFLGSRSIQPSEIVKLSLCFYLARVVESKKGTLAFLAPIGITLFLIMLQPDLGTALIILAISMSQIFVSGINIFHFILINIVGIVSAGILILSSSYRKARLLTFLSISQDPLGRDYHIRQILISLGSGGLFGVGLGGSRQKYLFLPEAATDSVFAIVAEEIGFVGALAIILIFAIFVIEALKIARWAPDRFSSTLATGIAVWIGAQTILNLGSIAAIVPLTGVPLPFFSYGGSSLAMLLASCGILINISKYGNAKAN